MKIALGNDEKEVEKKKNKGWKVLCKEKGKIEKVQFILTVSLTVTGKACASYLQLGEFDSS